MIELFYSPTPNGKKISIMLEEIKFDYKITKMDLSKGDQFSSDFRKLSPFSKIPAIIDHKNKINLFQSGAILIYLAELSGKFYDEDNRHLINQWLMAQMGDIGPMLGQHHQFHHYNPGKSEFGEKRYFNIAKRIYKDLDEHLSASDFLADDNYSIADIATFPWIARHFTKRTYFSKNRTKLISFSKIYFCYFIIKFYFFQHNGYFPTIWSCRIK